MNVSCESFSQCLPPIEQKEGDFSNFLECFWPPELAALNFKCVAILSTSNLHIARMSMFFSASYRALFLLFFSPLVAIAQVKFVAQAPPTGTGEVRLQFVLSNAEGEDFTPPNFADFTVLAGPSVSNYSGMQIVNGRSSNSSSVTYTYILAPKRKGKLKIGSASIRVAGKTLHTQPLSVQVNELSASAQGGGATARPQTSPYSDLQKEGTQVTERDLYFTVQTSKKRVYEQEPIMLTYEIHARAGVGLANVSLTQKPELKGFWTQEIQLPRDLRPRTERIGNALYRVATNLQYLIFPQHSGTLTIPKVTFDCDIAQRREYIDEIDAFFNGMEDSHVKVSRQTQAIELRVLPLPQPKATGFSGGVGQMQLKSQLLTPRPKTNDVGTLRISIEGSGNLRLVKAPLVKFPKDFDSYEAKMVDQTKISSQGITGTVHFDYTFVPRSVGRFVIPEVEFVYFDTQEERYKTLRTSSFTLDVEKGQRTDAELDSELTLRSSDIRDIQRGDIPRFDTDAALWPGSTLFYVVCLLLLALVWGLSEGVVRAVRTALGRRNNTRQQAALHAQRALRRAKRLVKGDAGSYYEALSEAIAQYLADALGQEKAALTRQGINTQLQERGVQAQHIAELQGWLDELDFVRFAPPTDETQREDLWERAHRLVQQLHSQLS